MLSKTGITKVNINPLNIYIYLLLFLGLSFSKTKIVGSLYLHDLFLILYTIYSLFTYKIKKIKFPSIFIFIGVSVIYLIYSLVVLDLITEIKIIALRQYMLYFYLIIAYIYYNQHIKETDLSKQIEFLFKVGKVSVLIQTSYFIYLFIVDFENFSLFNGYNYYSPAILFGVLNYAAFVLIYKKGLKRWGLLIYTLVLSTCLGHASVFLALFVLVLFYFLIQVHLKGKIVAIILVFLCIWTLTFLPQFKDANASWRLMFWEEISTIVFKSNYGLLGEGFGLPYVSLDFAYELFEKLGAHGFIDKSRRLERWVSPPHNSFLTICFHTGFLSLLLLLSPLKKIIPYFFIYETKKNFDKNKLFLFLIIIAYVVWISFNVILELPHSAMIFWLVFFITAEYFSKK